MHAIKFIVDYLPYLFMAAYFTWAWVYVKRAKRNPNEVNKYLLDMIPQIFTTIGILGTFLGIAVGLYFFDVKDMEGSIPILLGGLKTAFFASIAGIVCYFIFSKWIARVQKQNEHGKLSDEAIILNKLTDLMSDFKAEMLRVTTSKDESNNQATIGNLLREISIESREQSKALKTFSTDLALTITAGFEEIFNNPKEGVVYELQGLRTEIESLGQKLKDPTTEMTQNVVKDLEAALERMVAEFKTSVSGSAKAEIEGLAKLLNQAGGALTSFPATLQAMTDKLQDNFGSLQNTVEQIAASTISQSSAANEAMVERMEGASKQMHRLIQGLQAGQGELVEQHQNNLALSDKLLNAFNSSISRMDELTGSVNQTISKFAGVEMELSKAISHLTSVASNVNSATREFGQAQQQFSGQNQAFLENNRANLQEIKNALSKATEVSADYARKFEIIEQGLKGIFGDIQTGLEGYSATINSSLASYLDKYSESMKSTVQSLAGATEQQREILEDLTEELNKFSARRN